MSTSPPGSSPSSPSSSSSPSRSAILRSTPGSALPWVLNLKSSGRLTVAPPEVSVSPYPSRTSTPQGAEDPGLLLGTRAGPGRARPRRPPEQVAHGGEDLLVRQLEFGLEHR